MAFVESGIWTVMEASLWLTGWILASHGFGSQILRGYLDRKQVEAAYLYLILSISAGLLCLSLFVFVIGSLGLLKPVALWIFLAVGLTFWMIDFFKFQQVTLNALIQLWFDSPQIEKLLIIALGTVAGAAFIAAQAPATGNDALAYHLLFPKQVVEASRIVIDPTHPRALWPFFTEMLFTAGLLLQGVALAKLFSWLTAVLAVLAVPAACTAFFKDKTVSRAACCFMLFIPAIWQQTLSAYVDNTLMLYTFLSFMTLILWVRRGFSVFDGFICSLFLSSMISIKYLSLFSVLIFIFIFLPRFVQSDAPRKKLSLIVMGLGCFCFSGFWFLRSWMVRGNPVFPYLNGLFNEAAFRTNSAGFSVLPKTFLNFVLAPWHLSIHPDFYGGEPIGILFLIALPLIFFRIFKLEGIARRSLLYVLSFFVIWFFAGQRVRFLFPIFPFLSVGSAVLTVYFWKRLIFIKPVFKPLLITVLFLQLALALYYPIRIMPGALGIQSADQYLTKHERTYAFAKKLSAHIKPHERVLVIGEPRLFYFPKNAVHLSSVLKFWIAQQGLSLQAWIKKEKISSVVYWTPSSGYLLIDPGCLIGDLTPAENPCANQPSCCHPLP